MSDTPIASSGTLFIVATPIGNLEDITLRALRTLKEVEYIAAEDTRHTKKLLNHFGIKTKLISYYREQEVQRAEQIINFLAAGHSIAIVTDAGTPCISDPGAVIVQRALQEKFKIVPIPGPSALTAALSCAGLSDHPVMFYGFAPAKKNQRRQLFQGLLHADHYSVFYESPHRIEAFVKDAHAILENRQVFMARELTKNFEEIVQCNLEELSSQVAGKHNRGEFVVILAPGETAPAQEQDLDKLIRWYRDHTEVSLKDCSKTLAADLGVSRSLIYQRALQIWQDREDT